MYENEIALSSKVEWPFIFQRLYHIHQVLMNIGPCISVVAEEYETNLMSLAILFHFFYAQHVSDINTSIIRSLRISYCITTLGWPRIETGGGRL